MLSFIHRIAGYLLAPVCVITWLTCLVRHWRAIRAAEVIIQARRPCAFGTTFNMIELVRRLYPNKRITVLVFREPKNHNPKLGLMYPDEITFVSWPRPCFRTEILGRRVILPSRPIHDAIAVRLSELWFRCFARDDVVILDQAALYQDLPVDAETREALPKDEKTGEGVINSYTIDGVMWRYFASTDAALARLEKTHRERVVRRIEAARGDNSKPVKGWCGMHLKEDETGDTYKDGSPLQDYLPAINEIIAAGYQILLKGDRKMDRDLMATFDGMVVDAQFVGVDEDIFNLFVITDSSIFVGDSGPGTWMAGLMDYPVLALNVFPIGLGFASTWVYYKGCRDDSDEVVPAETVLAQAMAFGTHPEGWKEFPMTEAEITEAVEEFLVRPMPEPDLDGHDEIVGRLPKWTCFRTVGVSRLAPSWVRRNFPDAGVDVSAPLVEARLNQ